MIRHGIYSPPDTYRDLAADQDDRIRRLIVGMEMSAPGIISTTHQFRRLAASQNTAARIGA